MSGFMSGIPGNSSQTGARCGVAAPLRVQVGGEFEIGEEDRAALQPLRASPTRWKHPVCERHAGDATERLPGDTRLLEVGLSLRNGSMQMLSAVSRRKQDCPNHVIFMRGSRLVGAVTPRASRRQALARVPSAGV